MERAVRADDHYGRIAAGAVAGAGREGGTGPQSQSQQSRQQPHPLHPSSNSFISHQGSQQPPPPQNPFASREDSPERSLAPPTNGRLKSELYDSFLNGYFDLYQKRKSEFPSVPENDGEMADRYGPPAGSAYGGPYQQQRPQPPPHTVNYKNNNHNENDYYANNSNNNTTTTANTNYDDARQPLQQGYHSPYRDSPSPDYHPGINPSANRYNQSQPSQPYESPSRRPINNSQRNQDPYGPAAASSSASGYRGPQDQSFQSYTPQGNMGKLSSGRGPPYGGNNPSGQDLRGGGDYDQSGQNSPFGAFNNPQSQSSHGSYSSADHLTAAAAPPALSAPQGPYSQGGYGGGYGGPSHLQNRAPPNHPYQNPYDNHSISRNNLNGMDFIDPNAVADDGDDGLQYYNPKRRSMISLNRRSMGSNTALAAGAAAAGTAAVTAGESSRNMYTPDPGAGDLIAEKSTPAAFQNIPADDDDVVKSSKWKKWLFIVIGILILGGIAAGVVVGLMERNKANNSSGGSSTSSQGNQGVDGPDFNLNSPSVKKLLNNKNLHKVFMGMAYTPMNTQYPDCLTNKPLQNNITLDMAVIGQTTNVVRLYGTDCNQTEMVLHAIDQLQLTDMKVWLGVWLDNNMTTNARQVQQLYNILDGPNTKYIKGVVVGNEVLFRQDLTVAQLGDYITNVRSNLTSRGINLPVASSDLGDNWTTALASAVDVVMSNVHPFFGGVAVEQAASWTWTFWQGHDVILTQGTSKGQVISEVGWPSQGGNDCSPSPTCPDATSGSVAGISQMNTFLNTWVCQALANGTEYLW
jgi:exo-beta-1,3-glucanase (GH17 family)